MSTTLSNELRDLCIDARKTTLYRNSPSPSGESGQDSFIRSHGRSMRPLTREGLVLKSQALQKQRQKYLADPKMEVMRKTRMALPVHTQKNQLLSMIEDNVVLVCMATTGSGKTTQIPQIILDEWIDQGRGGECNILCTQPRRLAALSVADRVAKERGESLGQTVGFQVRFESQPPEDHGSITFCTTGVFLKKLQTALSENVAHGYGQLDHITHVVVDEVHERDVDTDLLLAVLKRLINVRKARNNPIKVILMSATIDPSLFQSYFADVNNGPAKVIDIPGRSFPVNKYFMDDFIPKLVDSPMKWVFNEETVAKYVGRELGDSSPLPIRQYRDALLEDELDIPYTLVAAMISYVLQQSDSGHVLVFLPGWDDIVAVQRQLQNPPGPWTTNFNDRSKISLHLLHSSIPLAEQQVIFDPPAPGIRRIILSTNIAETSVTIPDVVYVVDTARLKEQRFDPERHIMSLVSAWVGSSNLNQRAGRAGRHRSGDYFGLLSRQHAAALQPYQTVEMSRVDLSNVVMHVKALNFPQMTVEEVLEGTIEPPSSDRVTAAMTSLQMVGALDQNNNLTSLGHVLLQLPVDVQVGRLVLYGSFFRCLDQSLTLAAILTNREPWVAPMHIKLEAGQKKSSWAPENFRSDPLATLQAYNAWEEMQTRREYNAASRFCIDNFLARPTLLMIQKIKTHLLQSLFHAGVLQVSGGGDLIDQRDRLMSIPSQMNENGHCLPLLAALIASASQPKFAVRFGEKGFRTQQEKMTMIHPSSVNNRKHDVHLAELGVVGQVYAYAEKRRNVSISTNGSPMTFLVTTTRIDALTYILFGAHKVERISDGLKCDGWIRIQGNPDVLEDIYRLRMAMDACTLRVYEGIILSRRQSKTFRRLGGEEDTNAWEDDVEGKRGALSKDEMKELDLLSRDVIDILNRYSEERLASDSRPNSRPASPSDSFLSKFKTTASSHATPYASRAPTPLGRGRRF